MAAGCNQPQWTVLPYPIPMQLAGGDGALVAAATADAVPGGTPFPLLVDTATMLTTFDDGTGTTAAHVGGFTMFGVPASGTPVPRFVITNVPLFTTPLATVGVGSAGIPIRGVIGGDNLARFVVSLDYRGATPTVTLANDLRPCKCELSSQCQAVMDITLAGGQETQLQGQTFVQIGNDLYNYPPTRALVDACLEPLPDPLSSADARYKQCAGRDPNVCPAAQYMPSGVDVKLVVATGFPGLGLSANAYDRLRGAGAAAQLLSGPTVQLHLGDQADEGVGHAGVAAALTTLGRAQMLPAQPGASALALVGHEGYFGPCAELARSRRLRRYTPNVATDAACLLNQGRSCSATGMAPLALVPLTEQCVASTNSSNCNDTNGAKAAPAAAVVELTKPLPVYVLPDVTPLLLSLNADVRPGQPSIDGVVGTEALRRMVATIDYTRTRLVARCASSDDCVAYAELTPTTTEWTCTFCINATDPPAVPYDSACAPAPAKP